jgi:uncharacterized membrane protein (DUF4010 family)
MSGGSLELAWRLALVAALAIFMGLAFEETYKREDRSPPGGIRSFPMLAIGGAMLYLIEPHYAAAFIAGLLGVALWLYAALQRAEQASLMVPTSSLVAYALGPVGLTQEPWVPVAASVAAVLLLGGRERLHGLIQRLPKEEVVTAGMFLILVGVILPLVPHRPLVSFVPLTPYQVWLAVIAVCSLSYASYLVQKYIPFRDSALLPAVFGGMYSSTATTIVLAKQQRDAKAERAELSAGIITATSVMYIRLGVVVAVFNGRAGLLLAPALLALFGIGLVAAVLEWRRGGNRAGSLDIAPSNPLQIPAALLFAGLFVLISVVTAWTRSTFGSAGLFTIAAVVGVSDIDPYVINLAQGGVSGLSLPILSSAILIAASSNNIAKAAYTVGFGGSRRAAVALVGLAALGLAAAYFYAAGV